MTANPRNPAHASPRVRAVFIANQPCINYFAPACRFNSGPLTEIVVK